MAGVGFTKALRPNRDQVTFVPIRRSVSMRLEKRTRAGHLVSCAVGVACLSHVLKDDVRQRGGR